MGNFEVGKVLLKAYKYLEPVADKLDACVEKESLASCFVISQNAIWMSTQNVADRIIDLMERKKNLINLKVIIEKALSCIADDEYDLICKRYFEGIKFEDIATMCNITERTLFRKVDHAVLSFLSKVYVQGFCEDKIKSLLCGEKWLCYMLKSEKIRSENYAKIK